MIAERCKELLEEKQMDHDDAVVGIDVLVPTAYSFPSVGTLLGLGFILFAAWFVGAPLEVEQYPAFVLLGLFTAFGTMNVALPFLLDFLRLQADLFQLYLLGSVITGTAVDGPGSHACRRDRPARRLRDARADQLATHDAGGPGRDRHPRGLRCSAWAC